ncbi:hypothetical protein V7659_30935, partial [Neobacillus drentensis]
MRKIIIIAAVAVIGLSTYGIYYFARQVLAQAEDIELQRPERDKYFKMAEEENGEVPCYEYGKLCEEEA